MNPIKTPGKKMAYDFRRAASAFPGLPADRTAVATGGQQPTCPASSTWREHA